MSITKDWKSFLFWIKSRGFLVLKAPLPSIYSTYYSQALSFSLPASPEEEQMLTGWSMLHCISGSAQGWVLRNCCLCWDLVPLGPLLISQQADQGNHVAEAPLSPWRRCRRAWRGCCFLQWINQRCQAEQGRPFWVVEAPSGHYSRPQCHRRCTPAPALAPPTPTFQVSTKSQTIHVGFWGS